MKTLSRALLLAGLLSGLAACAEQIAEIQASGSRLEEGHLRDAGFTIMLADRMDRQQMLNALPAGAITRIQREDGAYYIYPDPDGCVCLYVGREGEYQRLRQLAAERQVSDRQLMVNDMAADAQNGWGPGAYSGSWNNNNPGRPSWDPH
jgi:hypothetical protein